MRRITTAVVLSFALLAFGSSTAGAGNGPSAHKYKDVCTKTSGPDTAACNSKIVTLDDGVTPFATTGPTGYGPSDLISAYNLAGTTSTATIAIVDAYDNPNAESDLAVYRSTYGLAPCTTANGCFKKVNQNGAQGPYPAGDVGWGQEIDLDIEMASAICPTCNILLVEANSNGLADLGTAVNRAASMGATAISNSYGTSGEFIGETSYDSYYNHPGIAVTASSGDSGYGTSFPAASNHVVAVGGTALTRAANTRGWSETAWSGAGSGCSSYYSKPSWQTDSGCSTRMEADVSAVADPNTGVSVYDSYGSSGGLNWYVFGGTSVSSPIIASVYALANNTASTSYPASLAYANTAQLNDVTSGSNGNCVRGRKRTNNAYFCTAGPGYDGPTGLGTPNGTGAF